MEPFYFSENGTLHFPDRAKKKNKKNPFEKNSLYFRKWNFLALILKKLLYFRPQPSKFFPKKTRSEKVIFSQKKAFLIFPEMKPCTFHPKPGN